jgi:cytochrome P450
MTTTQVVPLDEADLPFLDKDSEEWALDPVGVAQRLHRDGWIARSDLGIEVLSHAVCREMLLDERIRTAYLEWFVEVGADGWVLRFVEDGLLPCIDGEKHTRIRSTLKRGFLRSRIDLRREEMRAIANRLVDGFIDRGQCDFSKEFAEPYPIEVVCTLLGVPREDIPLFMDWTLAMGHIVDHPLGAGFEETKRGIEGVYGYLDDLIAQRTRSPQDDFMTTLIQASDEEGRLSRDELILGVANLLMAGQDTTRFQLGWTMELFGRDQEQWREVCADPALIPNAVQEAMRLHPSARSHVRKVVEEVEYRGVRFPVGTMVRANTYAAHQDPTVFPDPGRFDIRRSNANRQLTFGFGMHHCLGAALATSEMVEALEVLAERLPAYRVTAPAVFTSAADGIGGVTSLELAF